jgi:hypothetical protein
MNGKALPRIDRSRIESAAALFEELFHKERRQQADAVRKTGDIIERHLWGWRERLRSTLEQQLAAFADVGFPPSFVHVAGQRGLEKPLNRLLAWLGDPGAEHGLGTAFLVRLSHFAGLPELAEDLERGEDAEIRAEATLEDDDSGREPDLVVRTSRAALLLENKVHAAESGPGQYSTYLEIFKAWAAGTRKTAAILCSRGSRKLPDGWTMVMMHADVSNMLYEIGRSPDDAPTWGRIAAVMCAVAFEESVHNDTVRRARALLDETRTGPVTPDQISRLQDIAPLPTPPIPWERSSRP